MVTKRQKNAHNCQLSFIGISHMCIFGDWLDFSTFYCMWSKYKKNLVQVFWRVVQVCCNDIFTDTNLHHSFFFLSSTVASLKEIWKLNWKEIWSEKSYSLFTLFLMDPTTILQLQGWQSTWKLVVHRSWSARLRIKNIDMIHV